jgi:hypothetical protein
LPNRGSPPTVLLRESYREGSKVLKTTLANLSSLSAAQIEAIRAALRGDAFAHVPQSACQGLDAGLGAFGLMVMPRLRSSSTRSLALGLP